MPNIYEIDNEKVVGFEKEAQTIINQLIHGSQEREVVLITGMGGLGKTTLAKRVYDEKIVANHFYTRVWCTVSQEYDCKDLLNKIYNQVCGKETEIDSVAEKLRKSLMGWRYLIVLDDIWSLKAWEELNRAFPSCDNGSRIVLTSRQESVVSDAKHICLPFFTVDESWELLQVKLFKGKGCPKKLENIGKEISRKCGGLPLVVGLVAGLLEGVEKSERMWQEVLNTLSSHVAFRGGIIQSNDAIELSYNHLPDHLRPCLLYFAAIPEDKTIAALKLINLWISEGFIDIKEKERVEDAAGDFLNHLVGSNLVMVSKRKYDGHILSCRVHDLVRDFCLTKAKEENFLHIIKMENVLDPPLKLTPHRISFHRCSPHHEIPNELVPWNSSIRTLLGFKNYDILEDDRHIYKSSWVAKKFEHLTILDFEFIQVDVSIMFEVNSLIHLRYLALKLCGSDSISPWLLENLVCLVTLKLTSGEDVHLPKLFWNMRSLRHMVIHNYSSKKSSPMEGASTMETIPGDSEVLETLDLSTSLCIKDQHLLRKLPHLKKLRCGVSKSYPFAEIEFLHHLESLELSGTGRCKPHLLNDLKLTKLPSNVKEIHFYMITLSSSAISIAAQLSKLEALTLSHCEFEEGSEWNVDEEIQFRKLKYLQLFFLDDLRNWNVSSAAESFPCLEQLILDECFKLEGLSYSFADISTLELISVVNCPSVDSSVKEIQEDVQNMGSEQLTVHIESIGWWC